MEKDDLICSEEEEIIIEEFKTSSPGRRRMPKKNKWEEYRRFVILGLFALAFLLAVLAGILLLDLPVISVCVILVLEVLIGVCLHGTPVWLHGLEMMAGLVAGGIFGKPAFMVIASLMYLLSIFVWYLLGDRRQDET